MLGKSLTESGQEGRESEEVSFTMKYISSNTERICN